MREYEVRSFGLKVFLSRINPERRFKRPEPDSSSYRTICSRKHKQLCELELEDALVLRILQTDDRKSAYKTTNRVFTHSHITALFG